MLCRKSPFDRCSRRASSTPLHPRPALEVRVKRLVLELVVEAHVVHLLEHIELVGRRCHRPSATTTDEHIAHQVSKQTVHNGIDIVS